MLFAFGVIQFVGSQNNKRDEYTFYLTIKVPESVSSFRYLKLSPPSPQLATVSSRSGGVG